MTTNDADFSPNMSQHKTVEQRITSIEGQVQTLSQNMAEVTAALRALGTVPPTNPATAVELTLNLTSLEETVGTTTARGPMLTVVVDDGAPEDATRAPVFDELAIPVVWAPFTRRTNPAPNWDFYVARERKGDEVATRGFNGASLTALSDADADAQLRNSQADLRSRGLSGNNLLWPNSASDARVEGLAAKYFRAAAGGGEVTNTTFDNLYRLRRVGLYDQDPLTRYTGIIDQTVAANGWLILFTSGIAFGATQQALLRDIVAYARTKGMSFVTLNRGADLIRGVAATPAPAPSVATVEVFNVTKKKTTPLTVTSGDKLRVDQGDELTIIPQMIRDYRQVPAFTVVADSNKTVEIPYRPGPVVSVNDLIIQVVGVPSAPVRVRVKNRGWPLDEVQALKSGHTFNRNFADGDTLIVEPLPIAGYNTPPSAEYVMDQDRIITLSYASTAPAPTPTSGTATRPQLVPPQNAVNLREFASLKGYSIGQTGASDDITGLSVALDEAQRLARPVVLPEGVYGLSRRLIRRDWPNLHFYMDPRAVVQPLTHFGDPPNDEESGMVHFQRCDNFIGRGGRLLGKPDRNIQPLDDRCETLRVTNSKTVLLENIFSKDAHTASFETSKCSLVTIQWCEDDGSHGQGIATSYSTDVKIFYNILDLKWTVGYTDHGGIALFSYHDNGVLARWNIIRNTPGTATKSEGTANMTYEDNEVDGYGRDAFKIMPEPGGPPVVGGYMRRNKARNYRRLEPVGGSAFTLQGVDGGEMTGNEAWGPGLGLDGSGIAVVNYQAARSRNIKVDDNILWDYLWQIHVRQSDNIGGDRNKLRSTSGRRVKTPMFMDAANGGLWRFTEISDFTVDGVGSWSGTANVTFEDTIFTNGETAWGGGGTNLRIVRSKYIGVKTEIGGGNYIVVS
ncbi:hypothetical protein DAETH_29060 [Deinococcus aetherius]|uniref:Pectate lyase superfamily protein domain-containing protein n=1 Tax=Deinococcus aetherius TaxID=200252 RepID=A0ABN6RMT0_9DEIO|nr:hypothetical protein [Deinococcus aetherius]BDP42937.1 hypothetical protein DAETH_29060 [Deinococcus aetherius]